MIYFRIFGCLTDSLSEQVKQTILDDTGFAGVTLVSCDGDLEKLMMQTMYVPTTVFVDSEGNMVHKEMIGSPGNAAEAYRAAINEALTNMGKETLP